VLPGGEGSAGTPSIQHREGGKSATTGWVPPSSRGFSPRGRKKIFSRENSLAGGREDASLLSRKDWLSRRNVDKKRKKHASSRTRGGGNHLHSRASLLLLKRGEEKPQGENSLAATAQRNHRRPSSLRKKGWTMLSRGKSNFFAQPARSKERGGGEERAIVARNRRCGKKRG